MRNGLISMILMCIKVVNARPDTIPKNHGFIGGIPTIPSHGRFMALGCPRYWVCLRIISLFQCLRSMVSKSPIPRVFPCMSGL